MWCHLKCIQIHDVIFQTCNPASKAQFSLLTIKKWNIHYILLWSELLSVQDVSHFTSPCVHPHVSIHTPKLTRQQMLRFAPTVSRRLTDAMNVSPFYTSFFFFSNKKKICQPLNHCSSTRHSGHHTDCCLSRFTWCNLGWFIEKTVAKMNCWTRAFQIPPLIHFLEVWRNSSAAYLDVYKFTLLHRLCPSKCFFTFVFPALL